MCGIVGFISKDVEKSTLHDFTQRLVHRGPDSLGYQVHRIDDLTMGLGHTRLSILDLSVRASQPFTSSDKNYILSYNGEIYNFQKLKKSFKGYTWKTDSDTEVLCEGLSRYGISFIDQIRGMFAFAALDLRRKSLFLVRDRIGIKPLFYYSYGQDFAFGSELKSIKSLPLSFSINNEAIYDYLNLGYIPAGQTIYNEVNKVLPGQVIELKIEGNRWALDKYFFWKAEEKVSHPLLEDRNQAKDQLNEILSETVHDHLIADVEVGSFLSGGIDSSLVTALAQQGSSKKVKSFSIGLEDQNFNELPFARQVAEHLETDHYEFILTEPEAIGKIEKILDIYDEPFADSSALPTLLVSEMASRYVKVALSGDGGDELFMGYGMYNWADRLSSRAFRSLKPVFNLFDKTPYWSAKKGKMMLSYEDISGIKSHIFSQEQQFFSSKELLDTELNLKSPVATSFEQKFTCDRLLTAAEQQAFFDLKYYLPDDLLVKVDRASMHHSLEVRVPLLDHQVVEFALNLNRDLKMKGQNRKIILQSILFDYVPKELFQRPKRGFSIPLKKWLQTDLKYLIDNYLHNHVIEEVGIFSLQQLRDLVGRFENGEDYLYNRLWSLILLHKFLLRQKSGS